MFNYEWAYKIKNADPIKLLKKRGGIFFDKTKKLYYVLHNSKKLYYARSFNTVEKVAKNYCQINFVEQNEKSPHLYIDKSVEDYNHGIVVELGAAEASFALDIVETAKEIYIFECLDEWIEALQATFETYKNVHIIKKFVSDKDKGDYCSLDGILGKKSAEISLIKIDIEGYECAALKGMKKILEKSNHIMLLVCAYHNADDECHIAQILGDDFIIEPRKGYMLFRKSNEILQYPYFRRGVLKCIKREK